jgi:hypothetical protein
MAVELTVEGVGSFIRIVELEEGPISSSHIYGLGFS